MRTGDGGCDEQRRIDGVKQLSAFEDAESHGASRRRGCQQGLCKSYVCARAAAQMPMHSLVQLSTDTEDLSDAFLSCATRMAESQGTRGFKLVTG